MNRENWLKKYNKIVRLYKEESDRAAAVLAASFVDKCLIDGISSFLVDDPSVDELFERYGPLSTFSARIDIAFALGLITLQMKSDLTYIRKIRNHFAHHIDETSFNMAPAKDLCSNLSTAQGIPTEDGGVFKREQPRDQYIFAIAITLTYFDRIVSSQRRLVIPS